MKGNNHSIECGFRKVEISNETIELQPPPNLAGASDRGRRHHQNEDAIARDRVAKIVWLGDSCAYWLSPGKSLQLTQNDSWMRDAIESGIHTPSEAEASPSAHAIVRWLGADTTDDGKPKP